MYRANLIARNLHASTENRRKQERVFEKEIRFILVQYRIE